MTDAGQKIVAVSGARSGIGKATAERFRKTGCTVIGIDLSDCDINADLGTAPGRAECLKLLKSECADGLDAFVACAGLAGGDGPAMVSVNYFGTVELVSSIRPILRLDRSPRVVVVSSSAIMLESDPDLVAFCLAGDEVAARNAANGNVLTYASTKKALTIWLRQTAVSPGWAGEGVLLNAVAPGLVRTPLTEPLLASSDGREILARSAPYSTPWLAEPDHIAPLLTFLASPDNRHMVGQTVFCDGGAEVLLGGANLASMNEGHRLRLSREDCIGSL